MIMQSSSQYVTTNKPTPSFLGWAYLSEPLNKEYQMLKAFSTLQVTKYMVCLLTVSQKLRALGHWPVSRLID